MSRLRAEIEEIPARLLAAAELGAEGVARAAADWRRARPALVMTIARGTSDAAATFAARQFAAEAGVLTGSFTPSLASVGGFRHAGEDLRVLAISQSGASPDLRAALEAFPPRTRWALTNADGSPLEEAAAARVPIGAGAEESVAATKSFACSLLQIQALARALAGAAAPDPAQAAAAAAAGLAAPMDLAPLAEAASAYVIGRGATLCLAQEAAIKLKELCGLHAEAISAAEVMHGPKALAGRRLPVLGLAAGEAGGRVEAACAALGELGSPVALMRAPGEDGFGGLLRLLGALYPAVAAMARARGMDPDQPRALTKVTKTS